MKTCKPKVHTLEWDQWLPAKPELAAITIAWLASRGFGTSVMRESRHLLVQRKGASRPERIMPGMVIVLRDGEIEGWPEHSFRAEHDVVTR